MAQQASKWVFLTLLAVFGYLSYLIVLPFLSFLIVSLVLVVIFFPAYRRIAERTGKPRLSSLLVVLALLLLLVVPSILLGYQLVRSAPSAYESFISHVQLDPIEQFVSALTGEPVSFDLLVRQSVSQVRSYALGNAAALVSSASEILIGLFMLFFVMYYLFYEGPEILSRTKNLLPVSKRKQDKFLVEVDQAVRGIIIGDVVTGALQGAIGGAIFFALGIPNALFWGFIMAIVSIIPVLGSFVIWLPAALWLLFTGDVGRGVLLIILGTLLSQIDNFLRPYIVGRYAEVHPALVLVGVLGGLAVFGFVGFIVGPLILAILVALLKFYREDVRSGNA